MNRQPWDDGTRQQARALFIADGARLASEVTRVPIRTIRQWAKDGNWRQQAPAGGQEPDQPVSPVPFLGVGAAADAKSGDGHPDPFLGIADSGRELVRDLALARQVYRTEVERFLAGGGKASSVRDASVALAVLTDKVGRQGGGAGGGGGEFTWERHLAANQARRERVVRMLGDLLPVWRERARQASNGQAHG
jgi:hypothetical protein